MNTGASTESGMADLAVGLRQADRRSLVMRAAKVHCDQGEYLCIVRNISATGASLRFFHDAPLDETLSLEMANGFRREMHCRRRDNDQAGFEFSSPIDVDEFLDNPGMHSRPDIRIRLGLSGTISVGRVASRVTILDLSQSGACIQCDATVPVQQLVHLAIGGLAPRIAHIRWRDGHAHGLVFQQSFGLAELARLVHDLGPYVSAPVVTIKPRKAEFARYA